jgi:hypothetical protein
VTGAWTNDELRAIDAEDELRIATRRQDGRLRRISSFRESSRPAKPERPSWMNRHLASAVPPGIRLVVAIAPGLTIGFVRPSAPRSIASSALLHLSRETVRNHVRHLLHAVGAHSRLEAVAIARGEAIA